MRRSSGYTNNNIHKSFLMIRFRKMTSRLENCKKETKGDKNTTEYPVWSVLWSLINCLLCVLKTCSQANVPSVLPCWGANVPCVLTRPRAHVQTCFACLRALRACVPTYLAHLHAHVPTCLLCLRAHMPTCLACLCTYVSVWFAGSRGYVPICLESLASLGLRDHMITYQHVLTPQ